MTELESAYDEIDSLKGILIDQERIIGRLKDRLELKESILIQFQRTLATAKYWIGVGADAIEGEVGYSETAQKMRRFVKGEHDLT